jgi:fatty acid desaturase
MAWHNRTHHAHTNHPKLDPDAYPTLEAYEQSSSVRITTALAPGGGNWLTLLLPLFLGFSIQSTHVLLCAQRWGYLKAREYRLALLETGLGIAFWACVLWAVGPLAFLQVFVLPLLIANAIVMAFILTNHSLNPLTEVNDPLLSTLTVRLPPALEWLTLRFGYHVEHHVFPSMSSRYAPLVSTLLQQLWPDRYQTLPLPSALVALCRTARVYKDAKTLIHPATKKIWPTLGSRKAALLTP